MHYCQSCLSPTRMEPRDGRAWCPVCGRTDAAAAIEPLFVVTGASGSGKTAVFAPLAEQLRGQCITFDVDWLIDPAAALARNEPVHWQAFRDAWLAISHGVAQAGLPTLLLGPLIPEQLEELATRRWVGNIHYLLLDCPDAVRRQRIAARPPWRSRDIDEQLGFAHQLRASIADRVDTSTGTPDQTASAIAEWVRQRLAVAKSVAPNATVEP